MTLVVAHYTWSSAISPPADGEFCSDSRNWSGATQLVFFPTDTTGQDLDATFSTFQPSDTIRAEQGGNPGNWRLWTLSGPPAQAADLTWTLPVAPLDSGGTNVSNGQECYLVFTLADTPSPGSVASWTMVASDPTHWWTQVTCPHGRTRSGVWTPRPVEDDRNFLSMAPDTFANHRGLHPDCDCTLEMDWAPSYAPPPPPPVLAAQPTQAEPPLAPGATAGGASFTLWLMYPKLYGGLVQCQHGWFQSGIWQGASDWPSNQPAQAQAYQNHQGIFGCGDTIGGAPPSASAGVQQYTAVPVSETVALVETASGTLSSPFSLDSSGRLCVAEAGLLSISATFFLARAVADGAGGFGALRLPDASTPTLTAPSVQTVALMDDPLGRATATFSYAAQVAANTSVELNYWNGSQFIQDVQGGSLLVTLT